MNLRMREHRVGAVLAGGFSRRMEGLDKTHLTRDGQPVLQRSIGLLNHLCHSVLLIARDPSQVQSFNHMKDARVICDLAPGLGPLGGLLSALKSSKNHVLLLACDMPCVELELLTRLCNTFESTPAMAIACRTPIDAGHGKTWRTEPLCSIWSKDCEPMIEEAVAQQRLSISRFCDEARAKFLDLDQKDAAQLFNLNTPEDLARLPGIAIYGKTSGFSANGV